MEAKALFELKGRRVFIAGHKGMAGAAIMRRLVTEDCELITVDRSVVDLTRQDAVESYIKKISPDVVIIAAGKVGGIFANNSYPVDFLLNNLAIAQNLIAASHAAKVKKVLFLGSSCIFPREAPQPMSEDALLTGPLEATNEWYAIAKIAGIKLCQAYRRQFQDDFISLMPTNLYGPGDNYHPEHSHVPAALIRRMHEAKELKASGVTIWGTGTPQREFLFVDDLADACIFALKQYSGEMFLNVGTGSDVSIAEFARLVANTVGYTGDFFYDRSKPDGTPRKLLDVSRINSLGWHAKTKLMDGLAISYADFLSNGGNARNQIKQ